MCAQFIDLSMINSVKNNDVELLKTIPHAVHAVDERQQNLLFYATRQKAYRVMEYLIESGAKACSHNHQGEQPLHIAARLGDAKAIALLTNAYRDADAANDKGQTPLMLAAHKGSIEAVKELMRCDVKLTSADRLGNRVLHYAVQSGDTALVTVLLEAGASYAWLNDKNESLLHFAALHGYVRMCKQLLEAGLNPHIHNIYEQTALHYAARTTDDRIVNHLLSLGVASGAKDKFNQTPQDIAMQYGNQDALNAFMRYDTNDMMKAKTQFSFHEAIKKHHIDEAMMYIATPSKMNQVDSYGNLPIFYAIMNGEEYLVAQFINRRAQLERIAYDHHSALFHAVFSNRLTIAKRLLRAQPTLLDASVRTLIETKCDQRVALLMKTQ